jgi:fructosamine-3-kinase
LADAVGRALGEAVIGAARVGGGDVAESFRLELAGGRVIFAKTHATAPPGFFTTEARGLLWLAEPDVIAVPEVLAVSDGDTATSSPNFLALDWVDVSRRAPSSEAEFGVALAQLHQAGAPGFGRQDRRTTGSRGLPNEPCDTWADFYATQRLVPLARLATDARALSPDAVAGLERIAGRLAQVGGPPEPPARLHGDLWAGNRIIDSSGRSWLIDPAAHGGHREFDLAMMALFGGFGSDAFEAYDDATPLAAGWRDRVALHQLAPLVVHAIKFGGSYGPAATAAIEKYA